VLGFCESVNPSLKSETHSASSGQDMGHPFVVMVRYGLSPQNIATVT
jgi:hypothetical protein